MVTACTSAGQSTGQRTIGEILLLRNASYKKMYPRATSDTLQKLSEVTSLIWDDVVEAQKCET